MKTKEEMYKLAARIDSAYEVMMMQGAGYTRQVGILFGEEDDLYALKEEYDKAYSEIVEFNKNNQQSKD